MRKITDLHKLLAEAGMSDRYIARLRSELDDHLADLERETRAASKTSAEAIEEARARLGSDDEIAAAFLAQPELWPSRRGHPSAAFRLGLIEKCSIAMTHPARALVPKLPLVARYGAATAMSLFLVFAATWGTQFLISLETSRIEPAAMTARRYIAVHRVINEDTATRAALLEAIPVPRPSIHSPPKGPALHELDLAEGRLDPPGSRRPWVRADALALAAVQFSDYLPIVKVAPIYPARALSKNIEGYVVLEFTVARTGAVKNVVVVESSDPLFEDAAMEAAYKFKYSPRIVAGKPVEVEGVRNRITFDLRA